jgi:hypothetical protein
MKMHDPNHAAPKFAGKSRLGDYSDSLIERRAPASAFAKETASSSTRPHRSFPSVSLMLKRQRKAN